MAAIFAGRVARQENRSSVIVALDGAPRIGAKILIAGGGRCNVTNERVTPGDFNGNRNGIAKVLRTFDVPATIRFFEEIGVRLKTEETGKLFPVTDRAITVLDALLDAARDAGVEIRPGWRVSSIDAIDGGFRVESPAGTLEARRVILATGGRSIPKTGSDGAGYEIARRLGHTVTPVFPALVPLLLPKGHWMTTLSGVSCEVELRLERRGGKVLERARGAMLVTHFGLSGPAILDMSRHWIAASIAGEEVSLVASLAPGRSFAEIDDEWTRAAITRPHATAASQLARAVPERPGYALAEQAGVDASTSLSRLKRDDRRRIVHALTALELPITCDRGFDYAEVTAGGVPLSEIELKSMASRLRSGLYLCGEILDVDGRIGGFNFQWAWASGRLAGIHAGRMT